MNADREFLLWHERFGGLLAEWQGRNKDAGALLPPALLTEAERWLGERGDRLIADEREYIEEGVARRERDRRAEDERLRAEQARRERDIRRRSVRRTLAVVAALAVLGTAATLGASAVTRERVRNALVSDLGMVRIAAPPGGQFKMGCGPGNKCRPDETRHQATISRDFEMMSHEVTVEQFRRFVEAESTIIARVLLRRPIQMEQQPAWSGDRHPVVFVDWNDAREFCAFVRGRLPSEAQWEHAARGGNPDAIYPWGNDPVDGRRANYCDRNCDERVRDPSQDDGYKQSAPVGTYPAGRNSLGLYDMAGNVWEWTSSLYKDYPYRGDDGRENPASRQARVARGGSWGYNPLFLRVSIRGSNSPDLRGGNLGFRCARDGSP